MPYILYFLEIGDTMMKTLKIVTEVLTKSIVVIGTGIIVIVIVTMFYCLVSMLNIMQ